MSQEKLRPDVLLEGVRYPDLPRLKGYVDGGILTRETLTQALRRSCAEHAQRIALAGPEEELSYREFDERSDRLAAALLQMGLQPLDRAIFQCGNCKELLLAFYACLKAAVIPICALHAHRKHEISYLANLAGARMHLVMGDDPKFDDVAFAAAMQGEAPSLEFIVQARGAQRGRAASLAGLIAAMPLQRARELLAGVEPDPFQVAVFQLSGGTTGVPKIIPRFHNEYLYNMRAVAQWNGYTPEDVLFFPTPYMHNLNMGCFFGPFLLTGACVTVAADLSEPSLRLLVRNYQPTWFGVAGPILTRIAPELALAGPQARARRRFIGPRNAAGIRRATGSPTYHIFGMTEGVIMFAREGDCQEVLDTSVGRPVSPHDEVKLVVPGTQDEVPDGVAGEALFRGPYTIRGYYKSEKEDAGRFTPDGYYRSGDLMTSRVIDGKRYYFFCGRIKDVVDRGGEKINAEEVENVINLHPGVLISAVVAMPDKVYGEKVCAFVILRSPEPGLDLPRLCVYLEQAGLAKFKWPERLEVVAEFPLSAAGKLSKVKLRQIINQTLEAEQAAGTAKSEQS